ncbi:HNH endonuclease [Sphingobium sp. DC-2]|uniref:HNH endonuclease n=1 Tax=Sphingobium sp. DC-2 TaxID=1303256 RepID=UPI0009DD82CD|nr:HNH endonuclease [Sphingobium sp. DC-2]
MTAKALAIPALSPDDLPRFEEKRSKATAEACWTWNAAKTREGYGAFYLQGKMYQAHRVAVKVDGYAVPTNAVIDHICRNRSCVNPAHLRTVDRKTNVHENSDAPAHINSLKTRCPVGHPYEGYNLLIERGRRVCRECKNERQRRRRSTEGESAGLKGIGKNSVELQSVNTKRER